MKKKFQAIRKKLYDWNYIYSLLFISGIILNTVLGILSEFEIHFSGSFFFGFGLQILGIAFSFLASKIFEANTD